MSTDIEFVAGMVVSRNDNAPEHIICKLWIKRDEFAQFMRAHPGDLNVEIKRSKGGKYYAAVDNWKPGERVTAPAPAPKPAPRANPVAALDDDVPF